jgi:hypothetical protein
MSRAECLHAVQGVETILAGEEIADGADTIGKSAQDGGSVGHALVAGDPEFGVETGNWGDFEVLHGAGVAEKKEIFKTANGREWTRIFK